MYNNSIEDIMINKDLNQKNKKGKSVIVIFVILILLLALVGVGYSYFMNKNKETNKQLFFKGLSNSDFKFFIENETHAEMVKKISNNNFEMTNDLTMSTTMKNEGEEITEDLSKYSLSWKMINNIENEENYNEFDISYSDNKLLNIKLLNNKEQIAIMSDEIVNKYVGVNKNNSVNILEKVGIKVDNISGTLEIKNMITSKKIEMSEEKRQAKLNEYIGFLLDKLGEEKFTTQENQISLVKEDMTEVAVNAYTLRLTQDEYNTIVKELLTKLKNDEELIKELITNNIETENSNTNQIEDLNSVLEQSTDIVSELSNLSLNIMLNKKSDLTKEDIDNLIDYVAKIMDERAKFYPESKFEMTVYVSELQTEKISLISPSGITIDIEFNSKSEIQKSIIITYLYKNQNINYKESDVKIYSALENILPQESQEETTNGVKIEIDKLKNDASTDIKIIYNMIEDKKINEKISLDLTTKGITTSKKFENECTVTYSNNDGETKVNIKNKIIFDKVSEIEKLTQENCLFIDTLTDEELTNIIQEIMNKIMEVYENKKENLNFIDTNIKAPEITQNNNINRDELRNLVVSTIGELMGQAIEKGEVFSLENIQNLQIQNHVVNVVIENGVATVSIDGVKFSIDSNFNLSDVE